ncbi:MAG TPA: FkbM family methyltransferase [Chlamydiales bacterium]|nr:FkbM family methyltransferase [Chlamydiales bacterium]
MNSSSLFGNYCPNGYEGLNLIWKGAAKAEDRLDIVSLFLPDNPIVFEAGAFDGTDTITLAKKWPEGKIISFEPNPNAFSKYQKRARWLPNTSGYNLAVNTYNGFATFYLSWGYGGNNPIFEGGSSLLKPSKEKAADYEGPIITVPCVVFDDWCEEHGIEAVDFMWLDLEGFEIQFLTSSPKILKTVQVIYTETNFKQLREGTTQFATLVAFLQDMGFVVIAHWYNDGFQGDAIFVRKERLN